MSATILNISEKVRQDPTAFVSLSDFRTTPAEAVPSHRILQDPTITLYCLDDATKQAIFVQSAPDADLMQHPFFYQAQFEHARRLFAVSYETLHQLAAALPADKKLLLIYSVGRCGSTLLSQVFDSVEGILSLSEPDYFTNVVLMRDKNGRRDAELTQLLQSAIAIQQKPLPNRHDHTVAIKFRSSGVEIADLIYAAYPDAKNLFLYRDAIKRTRSEVRAFNLFAEKPRKMQADVLDRWLHLVPLLAGYQRKARWGKLSRIEMSALAWLSRMDRYMALFEQGVPLCAIRYEDMISQPGDVVSQLFDFCDIPTHLAADTLHVFAKDSQAGSSLARTTIDQTVPNELTPKQLNQIRKLLQRHHTVKTPDHILPGTLNF